MISYIILGCRIEKEIKQKIIELYDSDSSLQHIEIYQSIENETEFKLNASVIR